MENTRFVAIPFRASQCVNGRGVVLTHDRAPVDQLLAPVFAQQLHNRR